VTLVAFRIRTVSCALAAAFALVPGELAAAELELRVASSGGTRVIVDATAVRYVASETGGPAHPRFISQRILAFEARLERMGHEGSGPEEPIDERHVRAAVEHHIAQELLGNIPHERPPSRAEVLRVVADMRAALVSRVGGSAALAAAVAFEGIDSKELDELVFREGLAALYIDRAIAPILRPSEDQLREAYRTASHPFRNVVYEEARASLAQWFVLERVRAAEASFFQAGRARVNITYIVSDNALP
jgi:hypothetical protein